MRIHTAAVRSIDFCMAEDSAAFGFDIGNLWEAAFPGVDFRVLTATAAFYVPVIREMWLWSYCF